MAHKKSTFQESFSEGMGNEMGKKTGGIIIAIILALALAMWGINSGESVLPENPSSPVKANTDRGGNAE